MRVTVRLFARLREIVGRRELERDVPAGATLAGVWRALAADYPALAPYRASISAARERRLRADGRAGRGRRRGRVPAAGLRRLDVATRAERHDDRLDKLNVGRDALRGAGRSLLAEPGRPERRGRIPQARQGARRRSSRSSRSTASTRRVAQTTSRRRRSWHAPATPRCATLAQEELQGARARSARRCCGELKILLLPKDPNDEKNVLLEIRAGTGGDEAALFAGELFRMYSRYAERQGWKLEVMSLSETGIGGIKEAIASIEGKRRLQPAEVRERRAPRAARAGHRSERAHPHVHRHRRRAARSRGSRHPDQRRRTSASTRSARAVPAARA